MTNSKEPDSSLTALKAKALKAYATKDYPVSSDLYAQACEAQKTLHGSDDAHLLYLYGRSLFKVAISKSDVLGQPAESKPTTSATATATTTAPVASSSKTKPDTISPDEKTITKGKGIFSFAGDENWDDGDGDFEDVSETDPAEGGGEEEGEEDEDEMGAAWEILDLARILFEKQLAPPPTPDAASASTDVPAAPELEDEAHKNTKIMLADVYDLLGEVSLESESFGQARTDLAASLKLKTELYGLESTLISEAHFKLSLALEFYSASEGMDPAESASLREQAAEHIQGAIDSCQARIAKETAQLAEAPEGDKAAAEREIATVKEMVGELEQRMADLRSPPETAEDPLAGLLGQMGGAAKKAIEEAVRGAKDLGGSGVVRKKVKKEDSEGSGSEGSGKGKRKLEEVVEEDEDEDEGGKKMKVDSPAAE